MTTREQALAEAAKKASDEWCRLQAEVHKKEPSMYGDFHGGFKAGASWEAQRSAVLLEALESVVGCYDAAAPSCNLCGCDSDNKKHYPGCSYVVASAALEKDNRGKR